LFMSSGDRPPSSISTMYLPSTGKNLKPWKLPPVAMYKPLAAAWGEMMKSELVVNASL
jgi:hypothetical protein